MSSYSINCPNGQVLKEIAGGVDKYGNEVKTEFRCVAPTSALDCPPNTRFYQPIRGIPTAAKCIPISNDGYDEGYGYNQALPQPQPKSQADCKEGEVFEEVHNEGGKKLKTRCVSCEQKWIEHLQFIKKYGPQIKMMPVTKEEFIAKCKGTTIPTSPVEKIVETIKPKTEEEEYRNFIFLTMAAIGVYLILSE